ncbi:helix-turn-helix domain-containing protein [candidate division KSB1 bacterium]|nr:helix-turn-helix domain-containing protein [candidate division KSB1 bacterium]
MDKEQLKEIFKRLDTIDSKLSVLTAPKGQMRGRLLSVDDVMVVLGVKSRNTIYKYIKELGGVKKPGGWRFKREFVEVFKDEGV